MRTCIDEAVFIVLADGDIGAIFGMGFSPFLGGPFRYIDAIGADEYVATMSGFAEKYGEQFAPCDMLLDYAKSGKKFHSD